MPIILYRVDERLIHGQVVVGWSNRLKIDQIVLVNDQVSSNPWERELYLACVTPEIKTVILPVEVAVDGILKNGLHLILNSEENLIFWVVRSALL